jgi:RsiW-degrading membrane proteinase PrsW (M82 family)
MLNIALALVPVMLLLAGLVLMDSFKLLRPASLGMALGWGALVAVACEPLNDWLFAHLGLPPDRFSRYVAPVTEESVKAAYLVFLLARRRVGFLVDAAVLGFAVGTGFAVVENFGYLRALPNAPATLWAVRGLGTAVLHGATTAIVAIVAKSLQDHRRQPVGIAVVPGLLLAMVIHSAYNHLLLPPVIATAGLLIVLPLVLLFVFDRGDRAAGDWVSTGLDHDLQRLHALVSREFESTNFGTYFLELKTRFEGVVVADMVCLLRLQLELSVQARTYVMARQAGLELPVDEDLDETIDEMAFLRRSIGTTGLLALGPLQVSTRNAEFHRHVLRQARTRGRLHRKRPH